MNRKWFRIQTDSKYNWIFSCDLAEAQLDYTSKRHKPQERDKEFRKSTSEIFEYTHSHEGKEHYQKKKKTENPEKINQMDINRILIKLQRCWQRMKMSHTTR